MKLIRLSFLLMCCFLAIPFLVQAQISAHFTCPAGNTAQTFNHTGALQTFTVPAGVTELTIYSAGATGGNTFVGGGKSSSGGSGGVIGGRFAVTPGETLTMLVGELGDAGNTIGALVKGGGGGGGSFVFKGSVTKANLLIAGGGGGGGGNGGKTGGSSDLLVQQPGDLSSGGVAGGGAGGAGIDMDGADMGVNAIGGKMIIAPGNGAGGTGGSAVSGGYGGGGEGESSAASDGGGGGGGYSGGEGGPTLGGDASTGGFSFLDNVRGTQLFYNAGGNPVNGDSGRDGQIVICYKIPDPVPTISQWGLFIFGLLILNLGLVFVYKREMV